MENQNPVQAQNQPLTSIQPQPTPPMQPEPPQPEIIKVPSSSSGFPFKRILMLLIALMIIVTLGGVYVLNKYSASKTPKTQELRTSITPSPASNAADPTANWKTYTWNNFTLKYPSSWELSSNCSQYGCSISTADVETVSDNTGDGGGVSTLTKGAMFAISKTNRNSNMTLEEVCQTGGPNYVVSCKDTTFNGVAAKKIIQGNPENATMIRWFENNYLYTINMTYLTSDQANKDILDQILSTFKFTDQTFQINEKTNPTPTPITNSWSKYSDSKYKFSFKLPTDWSTQVKDFPENNQRLINIIKNSSPSVVSLSFTITNGWDRGQFGNAQDQPKNYSVGGVPAYRMDPPTKTEQQLERYQTNVYFEAPDGHVFVFICTHNWNQDYLDTCNNILSTVNF